MKKQGMPEPLDEAHFTNLKRKAGMSVAESRAESLQYASSKKRRTGSGEGKKKNGTTKPPKKTSNGKEGFTNSMALPKQKPASKKTQLEDDDADDADLMEDEFDNLSGSGEEDGGLGTAQISWIPDQKYTILIRIMHIGQCFPRTKTNQMRNSSSLRQTSQDLSRKLDEELAEQEADAQAELEEAAYRPTLLATGPMFGRFRR